MTIPVSLAAIEARVTTLMCKGKNSYVSQWALQTTVDISGMTNATKEQMFVYNNYKTILTVMHQTRSVIDKFHRVVINNL